MFLSTHPSLQHHEELPLPSAHRARRTPHRSVRLRQPNRPGQPACRAHESWLADTLAWQHGRGAETATCGRAADGRPGAPAALPKRLPWTPSRLLRRAGHPA